MSLKSKQAVTGIVSPHAGAVPATSSWTIVQALVMPIDKSESAASFRPGYKGGTGHGVSVAVLKVPVRLQDDLSFAET